MQNVSLWALGAGIASVASLWGGHRYRPLRALHRSSAMVVGAFVLVHLAGHVAGIFGLAMHQAVLDVLRTVYRQPVLEGLLLGCALFQGSSGLVLLWRGRGQRAGRVAWLQAWSGGYLALFLLVHVGAVLWGRAQGLDTNFHFAAAGLHVPPWQWFFAPYYFLAVLAFWAHVGCAAYWNVPTRHRTVALGVMLAIGMAMAGVLVAWLAGAVIAVEIPARYLGSYPS